MMSKAAETLGSLHRVLVLASAALMLFAWKSGGDEFRYTHALLQARLVMQQHAYLAAEISREAAPFYAQRWYDLLHDHIADLPDRILPNWLFDAISSARFLPETIGIAEQVRPDAPVLTLALARDRLTLAQLAAAARLTAPVAAFDLFAFDPAALLARSDWLIRTRPPVLGDRDLTISVGPAAVGNCTLRFRSAENAPVRVTIPCQPQERRVATAPLRSLFIVDAPPQHYPIDVSRTLMQLPYDVAEAQLTSLAAREQRRADSELDLLGLKLDGATLGAVAPFAIFAVLLQMLATLPRHPDEAQVRDGEAWYDLFSGWRFWIMLSTLVVLPASAIVATALLPLQAGNIDAALWQVVADLAAALVAGGLGIACLVKSRAAARRWPVGGVPSATPPAIDEARQVSSDPDVL